MRWLNKPRRDANRSGAEPSFKRLLLRQFLRGWFFTDVLDPYTGYQPEIFPARGHVHLRGTWLSEKYFSEIAAEIRREFRFATMPEGENLNLLAKITACNAICVHVRRGDYVSDPHASAMHVLCDLDYYQAGFARICQDVSNPVVFVFSDDPAWTRANLQFPCETVYVTHNVGGKNFEDLRLMRACRHFITANSTFSWWAAWLADYQGKIIIAPKRWFRDPQRTDHPAPESWIQL